MCKDVVSYCTNSCVNVLQLDRVLYITQRIELTFKNHSSSSSEISHNLKNVESKNLIVTLLISIGVYMRNKHVSFK
jgi:hypothetical protein